MSAGMVTRWPALVELPVAASDLDADGRATPAALAQWFARAREAYLAQCPRLAHWTEGTPAEVTIAAESVRSGEAIRLPDRVAVVTGVKELGETWLTMACRMRSATGGEALVASGSCRIELTDPGTGRALEIPDSVRAELIGLEGRARFYG